MGTEPIIVVMTDSGVYSSQPVRLIMMDRWPLGDSHEPVQVDVVARPLSDLVGLEAHFVSQRLGE